MTSNTSLLQGMLWLMMGTGLPLIAFGQNSPRVATVTRDPLELVTGPAQAASTPESRRAALQLLARARQNFALRSAHQAYDLKVSFTVDSLGETNYDGAWEMEDLFAPGRGLRWTAKASSGYTITGIASPEGIYGEGTASAVPLRLHEARAVLSDPIQLPSLSSRGSIRTSTATFRGAAVTCVLTASARTAANPTLGRGWDETEECIDPQSGLLQVHSEAPGRYAIYEYAKAPQLGSHILPSRVTISEAGRVVSQISVDSLQGISTPDPSLWTPSAEMKARGPATKLASLTKISRVHMLGPSSPAMTIRAVCVLGMVTPNGQLVEAHSLQPSDPNSQAAVEDAKKIDFAPSIPAGTPAQQHFVFVIEKFLSQD